MNREDLRKILRGKCVTDEACEAAIDEILNLHSVMPRELTAENGSKGLMMGEFKEHYEVCDEDGNYHTESLYVSWTNIKEMHKKLVAYHEA